MPMAAAVPMVAGASSEEVPMATAVEAAGGNEGAPSAVAPAAACESGTVPQAQAASTEVLCLWCFKPFRAGEAQKKCGSCGSTMHEACAGAAVQCSKCGAAL